jgi:hypothetical protein
MAVEGRRWANEDAFESAENELGLDRNETRPWHRHTSLVTLAFAVHAVTRHRANAASEQTPPRASRGSRRSPVGRSWSSAVSPRSSRSAASGLRSSSPGRLGAAPSKPARDART